MGTGTYLLGVLRRIAAATEADQGPGSVPGVILSALKRAIGFEVQFGPFAVAQLRVLAEVAQLANLTPAKLKQVKLRLHITDTLGNPNEAVDYIPSILKPLAASRLEANTIKRAEPIMIVMGNPPYKEKAKGRGGWVEGASVRRKKGTIEPIKPPLSRWMPPTDWGVSAHVKHLRNLYVYFWRWATWKVFGDSEEQGGTSRKGIVSFITVAGFLNGPGFEKMRDDLRQSCDEIWIIDCSPEGHQPKVATRVFQGVQQPVCIVMASRTEKVDAARPAKARFRSLPKGDRDLKFSALSELKLSDSGWLDCPSEWRAPFLPSLTGGWATYPALEHLFYYNGAGVMPGRTWVIAPDAKSLKERWDALVKETDPASKETLFHPHLLNGVYGDRHTKRVISEGLHGHEQRSISVALDKGTCIEPTRYGFRSFDRQWIIPDNRLINRPNPTIWNTYSDKQLYITAPFDRSPGNGPALTFTRLIPDLHHYNGRGGRVYPLWADTKQARTNVRQILLAMLKKAFAVIVTGEDVLAYIAAVVAHPAYTARFAPDLVQPGLRVPITTNRKLFEEAVAVGKTIIWLHTFGAHFIDQNSQRPAGAPRMPMGMGPTIPAKGALSLDADDIPDEISYDADQQRLRIGSGYIDNVPSEVWEYQVSGKHVLTQWFSYRGKDRSKPPMGDRRSPSPLSDIQPNGWLPEYTTELLNVLHVLGQLVALEPQQADLLKRICDGPTLTVADLKAASPSDVKPAKTAKARTTRQLAMLARISSHRRAAPTKKAAP